MSVDFPSITDQVREEIPMLQNSSKIAPEAFEKIMSNFGAEVRFFTTHASSIQSDIEKNSPKLDFVENSDNLVSISGALVEGQSVKYSTS